MTTVEAATKIALLPPSGQDRFSEAVTQAVETSVGQHPHQSSSSTPISKAPRLRGPSSTRRAYQSELAVILHILMSTDCYICTTPELFLIKRGCTLPLGVAALSSGRLGNPRYFGNARPAPATHSRPASARQAGPGFSSLSLDLLLGCLLCTLHEPRDDLVRDLATPSAARIHLPDRPHDFEENALR